MISELLHALMFVEKIILADKKAILKESKIILSCNPIIFLWKNKRYFNFKMLFTCVAKYTVKRKELIQDKFESLSVMILLHNYFNSSDNDFFYDLQGLFCLSHAKEDIK